MRALKLRPPRSGLAQHPHVAAVPPPVALEDLDRGRLPGAVRAEEREDLAGLDREGEAVQDFTLAVGLRRPETAIALTAGEDTDGAV